MTAVPSETRTWWPEIGFGDRLRIIRRYKRRTQGEMAELLGVKTVTYGSWEAGAAVPAYAQVLDVARRIEALDRVPVAWTMGASETPIPRHTRAGDTHQYVSGRAVIAFTPRHQPPASIAQAA